VPATWKAIYDSQLAGVWLLVAWPALFLAALATRGPARGRCVEPYARSWVVGWSIVFAVVSIVDPIATGPLGWPLVPFVLLGDYRVFALVLPVMQPGRSRVAALLEAVLWTLPVPLLSFAVVRSWTALFGSPPETLLWIVYEVAFAILAVVFVGGVLPSRVGIERASVRRWVREVFAVVLGYYVLWAAADLVVRSGREWGWGLRILPNVLYYGAFVPVVYARFFAASSVRSSRSIQAAR
jgi:hypothetical protein